MGTSNFARPKNATEYFVIFESRDEKIVKCDECREQFFEYEEEYKHSEVHNTCKSCGSPSIDFVEESVCVDEWEVDNEVANIYEAFDKKFKYVKDSSFVDTDRNYPSSSICEFSISDCLADINIDVTFTIIYTSGYYDGATLDYLINFDIDRYSGYDYDMVDELTVEELYYSEMNNGMKKIQLPNLINKIKKIVEETRVEIENIFKEYSTNYRRVGGFSDGTSVYEKIN